jgi:ABC-2 type transport system ATP-binding protein
MHEPAIEARDLVKTYPKDVRALDGVGFQVERGSIFRLLGPNGAGKSTTFKILTTLSRPDAGEARVAGFDVGSRIACAGRSVSLTRRRGSTGRRRAGRISCCRGSCTAWEAVS